MELIDLIAEDDKVVGRSTCSGTHLGDWLGIAPTGRCFEAVAEAPIYRVPDGQFIETWEVEDPQPLGAARTALPRGPSRDETKHLLPDGGEVSGFDCCPGGRRHRGPESTESPTIVGERRRLVAAGGSQDLSNEAVMVANWDRLHHRAVCPGNRYRQHREGGIPAQESRP